MPAVQRRSWVPKWLKVAGPLVAISIGGLIVLRMDVGSVNFNLGGNRVALGGGTYVETQTIQYVGTGVPAIAEQRPVVRADIVENGGFENGAEGWGTGFYEGLFAPEGVIGLRFGGAVANWMLDDGLAHSGRNSLRVEHKSGYKEHRFSSLGQRIKVAPGHRYEAKFWAYLKESDKGSFALRMIPSRRSTDAEWERYKRKLDSAIISEWQIRTKEFESGNERFWDIRFTADTPMTVWLDDVVVTDLGPVNQPGHGR